MSLVNRKYKFGRFNGEVWITQIEIDKFMCTGYGVADSLGYKCPKNAIRDHVKPQWRKTWAEIQEARKQCPLVTSSDETQLPANWQPNTVFITEAGVYALIMRSKLPAAEEFQRWLFEEVLPELRKTGKYNIEQSSSSTDVVNYDKKLADSQMEALQLKLQLSEANTTISEIKRNYENQIAEFKEREYKMQLQMKDMANAANMTMTQFAVNALLAKDNIEENQQMRQTLTDISGRVVPELKEQPHKEEYITGYERMVNGKRRIRMCRSQLHEIAQQDKAIQRYRDFAQNKRLKTGTSNSKRYAWLRDSEKFLQLKCPNPVMVWLKVRTERPHMFYGLRYTNKLKTEMEVLNEQELRAKYRSDVEMCKRNRVNHSKLIEEFRSLNLENEDDCIAKCLVSSVDVKERINTIVEKIIENMSKEFVPTTQQRSHSNAGDIYTAEQVVHAMNNCQNYFVKNIFNINLYGAANVAAASEPTASIENVSCNE
ncbi:baculovirus repeated ORF [Spodoptera exempta nucleopolyhedrovirus]|uniref:Baculovirus repeated ORF n=1 Tax=Spodoptera exempta nucleopolyhedrovirus TaxID=1242863 RepID=A0A410S7L8_9ABAC|nr:baculovirus repeated ORF [Spodoptera exempta nucleopolyhedrovirus]QAT90315.1 baculovirus repeated ORF [Spodoptera exempta nucleopolyhedrovirus]